MALCLAESLVKCHGFDPVDQLERYARWFYEGYWSSTGECFDIGNATRAAIVRFERMGDPYPGDANPQAAGNGPLMKLAPIPLAYVAHPALAVEYAGQSARTTHGAPEAVDGCRYFAGLLVGALHGASARELLEPPAFEPVAELWQRTPLERKIAGIAAGSFLEHEPPTIRGGGYVVEALEAALWALNSTASFEEGVLAAVNLGDDADTTGAIFGQLAGALYGLEGIPERWRERVIMGDKIVALADRLFELAGSIEVQASPASKRASGSTSSGELAPQTLPGDSYWAIPEGLLAGPYPGAPSEAEARVKLGEFLDVGVTRFIDLTEDGEGAGQHRILQPYATLLRTLAADRGIGAEHLRMPIKDVTVPSVVEMRQILATIRRELDQGEAVYVHCRGGVGRTGTVVGCLLVEDGTPPAEVLERIAEMRAGTDRSQRRSPETEQQREFVRSWRPSDS